jgi:hypothetical protein
VAEFAGKTGIEADGPAETGHGLHRPRYRSTTRTGPADGSALTIQPASM